MLKYVNKTLSDFSENGKGMILTTLYFIGVNHHP